MAQLTVKRTAIGADGKPEETEETYDSSGVNVQLGAEFGLQRWQLQPGESVSVELAAVEQPKAAPEPEPEESEPRTSTKKKGS